MVDRVLQFDLNQSQQNFSEATTAIRGMSDATVTPDLASRTLTVRGTETQLEMADWLHAELTRPAGQIPATSPEFRYSGEKDNVARVFYLDWTKTTAELLEATTAVRSMSDTLRVYSYVPSKAVLMRGTQAQMALNEWLFQELKASANNNPPRSLPPSNFDYADAPAENRPPNAERAVKVLHFAATLPSTEFLEIATAIRSISETRRAFPYSPTRTLTLRGTPEQVALSEWLYTQLDPQTKAVPAKGQFIASDPYHPTDGMDDVVKVFLLPKEGAAGFRELATQIHTANPSAKIYPSETQNAVVVRGNAGQLADAERIVTSQAKR